VAAFIHPYIKMRGFFITLEGIDGCGKSTQLDRLAEALNRHGFDVVKTRQPGGTLIGQSIRALLVKEHNRLAPVAEVLLMMADRAQHVAETIKPNLEAGRVVISDRYIDSSIVFQGYGRGLDISAVEELNRLATGGLTPDLTLLFDLEPESARTRLDNRVENQVGADAPMTGFDEEQHDFHLRVRQGYLKLAAQHPDRIRLVDAVGRIEEIHEKVLSLVLKMLSEKSGVRVLESLKYE
jgi:dTMP kinase